MSRSVPLFPFLFVLALSVAVAGGAEKKAPAGKKRFEFPPPAPEIVKLQELLRGRWKVAETWFKTAKLPEGGTGQGRAWIHRTLDGHFLRFSYRSKGPYGWFRGTGYARFDRDRKMFQQILMSGFGAVGISWGSWEGARLVFRATHERGGKKFRELATYEFAGKDAYSLTLSYSFDEGKTWQPWVRMDHTRIPARVSPRRKRGADRKKEGKEKGK